MKIGELSSASSTPNETIRFYEREGLLPKPARTQGNFRIYESTHLERLQLIRHCRSLDMSLDEIRVLLRVKDEPTSACGEVNLMLDAHIGHVTRRITELKTLQRQLVVLRKRCGSELASKHCGILEALGEAAHGNLPPTSETRHLRSVHG